MSTIPCYRCGHPISIEPKTGRPPESCPGCGHHFGHDQAIQSLERNIRIEGAKSVLANRIAGLIALVICMAGGALGEGEGTMAYSLGKGLGSGLVMLVMALLLAGIAATLLLIFRKPFSRTLRSAFPVFAILLACVFFAVSVGKRIGGASVREKEAEKQTIAAIQREIDEFEREFEASVESGRPMEYDISEDPVPTDKWEANIAITRLNLKARADFQNAHVAGLLESGFHDLMVPERLAGDTGLAESKAIIARTREFLAGQRVRLGELIDAMPARMRSVPHSEAGDPEWMRSAEKAIATMRRRSERFLVLESESVNRAESIIVFLASKEGQWKCREGRLEFDKEADSETFNDLLRRLENVGEEQERDSRDALEDRNRLFNQLQSR